MTRRRVIFFLFVVLIAIGAILFTMTTAPTPALEPAFFTPTATATATYTPPPSPTTLILPTSAGTGSETNCTYTFEDWRRYPDAWGFTSIRIGSAVYDRAEILSVLNSADSDVYTTLQRQLFTAVINQRYGASPNAIVETLTATTAWLNSFPPGSALADADRQQGLDYAAELEAYNLGQIGPGQCSRPIETPVPTATATPVDSPTPTQTITPVATATRTPRPSFGPFNPTATRLPTQPNRDRPPRPTATRPPAPTQPPPTQPPPPTSPPPTQPPPPTAAPTEGN